MHIQLVLISDYLVVNLKQNIRPRLRKTGSKLMIKTLVQ